ncbi:MAG: sulfurtransferase TusA family protein [Moraxella sp.]|nr:sulfurtransferase TusA family protein [Moraxella sp.]
MYSDIYTDSELAHQQSTIDTLAGDKALPTLSAFIDGRGLHCPMPLLKLKIALRNLGNLDTAMIYLVATDKNSATDISTFCQKNHLSLDTWQSSGDNLDTIFHFIITKNTGV